MKHLTIAIDFDNTIAHTKWPSIGEPLKGAKETIQLFKHKGHKIIIWTCRSGKQLEDCKAWLHQHSIPYDTINENLTEHINHYGGDTRKVHADIYIDDKAIGMHEVSKERMWIHILRCVNRLSGA